jgi:CRP/FNR family cyclic AMP-dependent transcriptional regulator
VNGGNIPSLGGCYSKRALQTAQSDTLYEGFIFIPQIPLQHWWLRSSFDFRTPPDFHIQPGSLFRKILPNGINCRNEEYLISDSHNPAFDPAAFLANAGLGRRIITFKPKETFFTQGEPTDSVFYLQKGRARLTVVSQNGKEATITLLSQGDFVGEECLAAVAGLRMATASAVSNCTALKIGRDEMIRVMHDEPSFADLFLKFLLSRSMRTQADLVDQLFNSSEKRLARILLIMAEFGKPGEPEIYIPPITQESLADMIGTTRSRVSFFMNRFRKMGFISYNGRIQVHKSLLNVVLLDKFPEHNSQKPDLPNVA